MERIIGWTSKMMKLLSSGGLQSLLSIVGEAAALAGTSMPDMAAVMQSMQTEIMGCGELLSHSTDSADEAQLGLMNDVLKGLSGSA
jgi:cob(I)alamin adenosyltransferase